ncbi:hypothetical protein GCM10022247_34630 [Allokutzneria multivorans]|uniref:Uncharacterized protein n=1 Tax=Allokutzneria multivorans TaxID=1142134 RepID=A0ABP7SC44_9PSEU
MASVDFANRLRVALSRSGKGIEVFDTFLPDRAHGERAVLDTQRLAKPMTYERFGALNLVHGNEPAVIIGGLPAVAGFLAGRWLRDRRARKAMEPRWHSAPMLQLVVTDRRFWCQVATSTGPGAWRQFDFDTITSMRCPGVETLEFEFVGSPPARLTGFYMPALRVVIEHAQARVR